MGTGDLDDEKLSLLAQWAVGLRRDPRAEVAAAGRAIDLLIDEVERLNVLLWDGPLATVPTTPGEDARVEASTGDEPDVVATLRGRAAQRLAPGRFKPA